MALFAYILAAITAIGVVLNLEGQSASAKHRHATDPIAFESADQNVPKSTRHNYMRLTCPFPNPDRFLALSWYTESPRGLPMVLYRIVDNATFSYGSKGRKKAQKEVNVTRNVTDRGVLTIADPDCVHNATYQCTRWARVGYRNERHRFRVTECTVSEVPDLSFSAKSNAGSLRFSLALTLALLSSCVY